MAPGNPRVVKAFRAMRDIGIPEAKVKPALKKLLMVYDGNWELIEGENYRVLADAIFEVDEPPASSSKKKNKGIFEQEDTIEKEEVLLLLGERSGPPVKRVRLTDLTLSNGGSLRMPKDEPIGDSPDDPIILDDYTPFAIVYPETSNAGDGERSPQKKQTSNVEEFESWARKENGTDTLTTSNEDMRSQLQVASSPICVNISLSCDEKETSNAGGSKIRSPQKETSNEEDCERSDQRENGTEQKEIHVASSPLGEVNISLICDKSGFRMPSLDDVVKLVEDRCLRSYDIPTSFSVKNLMEEMCQCFLELGSDQSAEEKAESCTSLEVFEQNETNQEQIQALHDMSDISKGQERLMIPVEGRNQELLASFIYITQNAFFQTFSVDFSLSGMRDDHCLCFGNCLSCDVPCACASETGGEFANTAEGLVKEKLLDEFISLKRKEFSLERSKNGHLLRRTFIKECWLKCRCTKKCGNRVVQRGISYKLQVFESQGKGWGLRALEDLPKGAFVCEFVGEVVTNAEVLKRGSKDYSVLLDADWGSERIVKDEEALCLDGSEFGNVARFINHRCSDANFIEIPVKIVYPGHHYYHIAFFTTREVKAMEELTWDYGIDFDDVEHPVKGFQCLCGSQFCRNNRRRSISCVYVRRRSES